MRANAQGSPLSNGIQPIGQYLTNNGFGVKDNLGISIHNSENKRRPNTM
jgi:hypothetical protein